jgi:anthranilate/para-aminobenzoate synthase component II
MHKRILIINNETHFIDDLITCLSQHKIEIRDFQTTQPRDVDGFDCMILSGGGTAGEVADNEQLYKNEIKIVQESKIPIFGICEGFHVIGKAFDSYFKVLRFYRQGVNKVRILVNDPIFRGIDNLELKVFEYHHIAIKALGNELISLAESEDGIEVMKHKHQLIYASQFHPEELQDGNNGHIILKNFLSLF